MLEQISKGGWLQIKAVFGLFAANGDGNDVVIWEDEKRNRTVPFTFPRQQRKKAAGLPYYCLSDYIAPIEKGLTDYIGILP